jgi:formate dehydrogenase iron-sulfur subunit
MSIKVFVPRDSAALSVGADAVAAAIVTETARRGEVVTLVRNGSRGLMWLEPMVEVETPTGRIAYGPVTAEAVPGLFQANFLHGGAHALHLGLTEEIAYFKKQERLTFARVGLTDPLSLEDYIAHGGYRGLRNALDIPGDQIVAAVTTSGLRGRGGAAFPTGIKWKTVLNTTAAGQKYIVCNADEGDSGTFSDRMIMEGDPFVLIEGMTIAAVAVGATRGYIYLRSEYPYAHRALNAAIETANARGYLGENVLGSGKAFHLEVRLGAGAYICGEETAMLDSLEGKRGIVRFKPPLPASEGLFGKPTVINNVISFASVPIILDKGAEFYRDYGMGRSRGTLPFQLAGNIKHGGLVEKAFGLTLRELLYDYGGGSASGRPIRAVQVGGPLGAYLPEAQFDVPLDYEAYIGISAMIGHGGIVAFDDSVDMAQMARYAMEFCAIESCGKCTPCRIGSTRGVEVVDRIVMGLGASGGSNHHPNPPPSRGRGFTPYPSTGEGWDGGERSSQHDAGSHGANVQLLRDLCDTMLHGSLCALGGMTPFPVLSALNHFPEDFGLTKAGIAV